MKTLLIFFWFKIICYLRNSVQFKLFLDLSIDITLLFLIQNSLLPPFYVKFFHLYSLNSDKHPNHLDLSHLNQDYLSLMNSNKS